MAFPQDLTDLSAIINSPWFMLALAWSMFWKGLALWQAAGEKQKIWFIVLFILNSFGILEIIYLVFVAKKFVEIKIIREDKEKNKK